MSRLRQPTRLLVALGLALGALAAAGVSPTGAQTADPASLPPQPGAPAPTCTPKLGTPNTWDDLGDPVLINSSSSTATYITSVDPTRPCVVYRTAVDARTVERSTDGGRTFQRVFLDNRTSSSGAAMHITGLYTPAGNVVYASEDGNGDAVIRSVDAGATWQPANHGIANQAVRRMWFAPSNPLVGYAAVETGTGASGTVLAFYATQDGGDNWTQLQDAHLVTVQAIKPYSLAIDPADAGHLIIGLEGFPRILESNDPAPGSLLLESHDFGRSFAAIRVPYAIIELLLARRAENRLRLYAISNGAEPGIDNGVFYSDDQAGGWSEASWQPVYTGMRTAWHGGLVDPVTPDKILYFGRPYSAASSMLFALYTRNGFKNQELAQQPGVRNSSYSVGQYRADRFGQFYLDIGFDCDANPCPGGVKSSAASAWVTLRFRPPDPGQAYIVGTQQQTTPVRGGTYAVGATCTVQPQAPLYAADPTDDGGSLAFDGVRLYYTRRGEQGPVPYSAVIRIADPATCKETGRLVVHFDTATYQAARRRAISDYDGKSPLLPAQPSIDSLSYDQVHDQLWFSVTRTAKFVDPYNGDPDGSPFPMWAVARGGPGVDRQADLRFWDNPCGLGGIGLLANDRVRDTLWTCDRKIPGERTRDGQSRVTCVHPLFQGYANGGKDVWDIRSWGVSLPGTLVALNANHNLALDQYDARACVHLDEWTPSLLLRVPQPAQANPDYASLQLACDPVTFRTTLGSAAAPPAVAWMRSGPAFTAYRVNPAQGPGLLCPWPTVLAYSGATQVDPGHRLDACATVTVPGAGEPITGVPVRISVAGLPARTAATDSTGRACVPYDVPGAAAPGSRLAITALVAGDSHLLTSSAVGSAVVGQLPAPPPPPAPAAPRVIPPPPPAVLPFVPAPAPAPAAQPAVQPGATPPGNAVTQQGLAGEKEREVQLAHAQQESAAEAPQTEPAVEQVRDGGSENFAFVAVAVATAVGALALGLARGAGPAPSMAYAPAEDIDYRRRARHRRRRRR